jgi:hypothetical protein
MLSEVQFTCEGCSATAPLRDKSAYPTSPQSIPSKIPSLPRRTAFQRSPRGKAMMSSTPHHHGSIRACMVMSPRSIEPMSTADAPARRTVKRDASPSSVLTVTTTNTIA